MFLTRVFSFCVFQTLTETALMSRLVLLCFPTPNFELSRRSWPRRLQRATSHYSSVKWGGGVVGAAQPWRLRPPSRFST